MSKNVLQLMTEKQIDLGAKFLDDLVDFTKVIKNKLIGAGVEAFDRKTFKISLNGLNDLVSPYIPDEFKDEFQVALDDVLDGDKDFTVASDQFFSIAAQLTQKLKDKGVQQFVISGVNAVIELISTFIHMMLENLAENKK
jgi:hypothetical protein